MTRHPSENFIKYLMTSPNGNAHDNDWVAMMIVQLGYPRPEKDYMSWLRSEVTANLPVNFQPNNRYHRESVRFMRDQGIYSLHNPDKAAKEAMLIVTNLRARPIIENLLLGRMEPKDVAKKVNSKLAEFYTAEGIHSYRHYYWNVGLLQIQDWAKLLEEYEVQRDQVMAILQVGPGMALHKMGFTQQLESKTVLRDMMETVFYDMREWKTRPLSASRTKAFTTLARAAVGLDVQLSQSDSAIADSLKAFEQFRMQHAEATVKDMRELAPAGNYTGSGAKLLEAAPPREDEEEKVKAKKK